MALTNNPNRSRGIEKAWRREINKRWSKFSSAVLAPAKNLGAMALNLSDSENQEKDDYMLLFDAAIASFLLSGDWQNKYQTAIYSKTVDSEEARFRSTADLSDFATDVTIFVLLQAVFDSPFSVNPEHRNELGFLHGRANDKLSATTSKLSGEVRQILNDNLGTKSTNEIAELIRDRIKVSFSSARRIAQTEITQAAQRSVITTAEVLSRITLTANNLRWITVNDLKVRHLHAGWHGQVMTQSEAKRNITISPDNCRCGFKIVPKGSNTEKVQRSFNLEREQLKAKRNKFSIK